MNLDIKLLDSRLQDGTFPLPQYESAGAAGMDVRACIDAPICVNPGETVLIPLGFALDIQDSNAAVILLPRSGLGHKHGIVLGNLVGLIDSDYQGQVQASMWNRGTEEFYINPGERIAQMVVVPVIQATLREVDQFRTETIRGANGFNSTGVK